jgi:hypothetical protein
MIPSVSTIGAAVFRLHEERNTAAKIVLRP